MSINIPLPLSELLTKLQVISLLDKDQKLNVSDLSFTNSNSWSGSLYRYYYGESRKGLINMLSSVIQQTVQSINDYKNTEFIALVVTHLNDAREGVVKLKTTYANDPNVLSQLEIMLECIDLNLDRNRSHIVDNFRKSKPIDIPNTVPSILSKSQTTATEQEILDKIEKIVESTRELRVNDDTIKNDSTLESCVMNHISDQLRIMSPSERRAKMLADKQS